MQDLQGVEHTGLVIVDSYSHAAGSLTSLW